MTGQRFALVWLVFRHRRAVREGIRRGVLRHRSDVLLSWLGRAEWREVMRTVRFVTYRAQAPR